MKTLLIILALAASSFAQKAVVTVDTTSLRGEPSNKGKITGRADKGESVRILLSGNGWLLVESATESGWLPENAVQKLAPTPPPKIAPRVEDNQSRMIYGRCKDDSVVFVDNKAEACKDHNGIALWYADDLSGHYFGVGQITVGVGTPVNDFIQACKVGDSSDEKMSFEDQRSQTLRIDLHPIPGRRSDCIGRFLIERGRIVYVLRFLQ